MFHGVLTIPKNRIYGTLKLKSVIPIHIIVGKHKNEEALPIINLDVIS